MSATKAKREPASERRLTAAAPLEPLVEKLTSLRDGCNNDHLVLAAIEAINDQTCSFYDVIDRAVEAGGMSPIDRGLRGATAGVRAADAIAALFQLRGALADVENEIREILRTESETTP